MAKHIRPKNNRDSQVISLICGVIFAVFCVLYLYLLQPFLIGFEQHRLSAGQTVYYPIVGTVILCVFLTFLGFIHHYLFRLPARGVALSWFPSCYLMLLLTCMHFDNIASDGGHTPIVALCVLPIIYIVVHILLHLYPDEQEERPTMTHYLKTNLLILSVMFFITGLFANTNHLFHYEIKAAGLFDSGQYDDVLRVGSRYPQTTRSLSAYRAYALSQKGELGEHLFFYPAKGSHDLLLVPQDNALSRHNMRMFRRLGFVPDTQNDFPVTRFLEIAHRRDTLSSRYLSDYLLSAYLLDRNLPDFVSLLQQTCEQYGEPLPRHFREALLLNAQAHQEMQVDSTAWTPQDEERFDAFIRIFQESRDDNVNAATSSCLFGDTYWHYYFFE